MKNTATKQTRVIVRGQIPLERDRAALCMWADQVHEKLTRSQYATVRWGRGGFERNVAYTWFPHGWSCRDAGVRIEQGNMIVVENYLKREVRRVPLAEIALEVVRTMYLPGRDQWRIDGWADLLVYCDHLDETNEQKLARDLRRWAEEMKDPLPTDTTARKKSYRRPYF